MNKKEHFVYQAPILDEVVFEARFPIKLNLEKYIGDFQEKIISAFPIAEPSITHNFIISSQKTNIPPSKGEKFWVFKDESGSKFVIAPNKIAISSKKYHSWDDHDDSIGFFNFIKKNLTLFNETYNTPNFDRIGLRYINKYSFNLQQLNSENFTRLFVPVFDIKKYPIEELDENFVRLQLKNESTNRLILQSVFQHDKKDKKIHYFLDFDAFCNKIDNAEVYNRLIILHDSIQMEFESLIKDTLRKEMKTYET